MLLNYACKWCLAEFPVSYGGGSVILISAKATVVGIFELGELLGTIVTNQKMLSNLIAFSLNLKSKYSVL